MFTIIDNSEAKIRVLICQYYYSRSYSLPALDLQIKPVCFPFLFRLAVSTLSDEPHENLEITFRPQIAKQERLGKDFGDLVPIIS